MKKLKLLLLNMLAARLVVPKNFYRLLQQILTKSNLMLITFIVMPHLISWQFNHPDTQQDRIDYLIKNNVIEQFSVEAKDVTTIA